MSGGTDKVHLQGELFFFHVNISLFLSSKSGHIPSGFRYLFKILDTACCLVENGRSPCVVIFFLCPTLSNSLIENEKFY